MTLHEKNLEQRANFCRNVAWLRKHYGISKKNMARLLGVGVGSLNLLEQGIIPPRLRMDIFFHIYEQFGIHPSKQLECLEEEKHRP